MQLSLRAIMMLKLSQTLKELSRKSGGQVSIAVMHIETGKLSIVDGWAELHLFSVFKLPLAIAVLKNVEEGSLKLDQQVHIGPDELAVGTRANSLRWQKPVDLSIRELLELSIIESDNTSSEKLLQLVGGPSAVTQRMRSS
jgi:beta-lactamase class A